MEECVEKGLITDYEEIKEGNSYVAIRFLIEGHIKEDESENE